MKPKNIELHNFLLHHQTFCKVHSQLLSRIAHNASGKTACHSVETARFKVLTIVRIYLIKELDQYGSEVMNALLALLKLRDLSSSAIVIFAVDYSPTSVSLAVSSRGCN